MKTVNIRELKNNPSRRWRKACR